MTTYGAKIAADDGSNFVAGDAFGVGRTVTSIPSGRTMATGYLTVKKDPRDADPGALQLSINSSGSSQGKITDQGASGTGALTFAISCAQSTALGALQGYVYDIKVIYDDGEPVTLEVGTLALERGVTAATS